MSPAEIIVRPRRHHTIRVVARRTGLSADVIRVWERRYGAVSPTRSNTNRRLYSDADIERLRLLRRATEGGRRIGDVARCSREELESLVAHDEPPTARATAVCGARPLPTPAGDRVHACLAAIESFDSVALQRALSSASVELSIPAVLDELIMPLLRAIGDRWREGSLRPAHEHMTTAVLRSFLGSLAATGSRSSTGPEIVVATPVGQHHELGALMVAVTAALEGWRSTYLGASLDAEEIASAARQRGCSAVALSIVYPPDDPDLPEQIRALRQKLPNDVAIIAGGQACESYRRVLAEVGVLRKTNLSSVREDLRSMRSEPRRSRG